MTTDLWQSVLEQIMPHVRDTERSSNLMVWLGVGSFE